MPCFECLCMCVRACVGLCVRFNIFLVHVSPPRSTHTSPKPVPAGSVHAYARKTLSHPGGVESRSQLVELGVATCVGTCLCWALQNHYDSFVPANRQTVPVHSMHTMPIHSKQIEPVRSSPQQADWACPPQAETAFAF